MIFQHPCAVPMGAVVEDPRTTCPFLSASQLSLSCVPGSGPRLGLSSWLECRSRTTLVLATPLELEGTWGDIPLNASGQADAVPW